MVIVFMARKRRCGCSRFSFIASWTYYEPSLGRLRGLAHIYVDSLEFADKFRQLDAGLPEFMRAAIEIYCDGLEGP